MSEPRPLLTIEYRKVSLLLTLVRLNDAGQRPTAGELIAENDGRDKVPRDTRILRRGMIRDMITRGLVTAEYIGASPIRQLSITQAGRDNVLKLGFPF